MMIVTTTFEWRRQEVEDLLNVTTIFNSYDAGNGVEDVCIENYVSYIDNRIIENEELIEILFQKLKRNNLIPSDTEDYSYEMCSCGKINRESGQDCTIIISVIQKESVYS